MIEFYIIKKKNCVLTFSIFRQLPEKKNMQNSKLTVFLMMSLVLMFFLSGDAGVEAEVSP